MADPREDSISVAIRDGIPGVIEFAKTHTTQGTRDMATVPYSTG